MAGRDFSDAEPRLNTLEERVTPVLIGQLLSFLTPLLEVTISLPCTGHVPGLQPQGGLTEDGLGD